MTLAQKVDANRFIEEIKKAPRGFVWMDEYHILTLHVLDRGEETVFEAPDSLDMSDTEWRAFVTEVRHWTEVSGIRERVLYVVGRGHD